MATVHVAIVYHSGSGHTARQAEAVARGAAAVADSTVTLHSVDALTDEAWAQLDAADAIVFGSPTYMGSPSAGFKTFAEATSKVWADNLRWRDKLAAGFTNSASMSGDKLNTLMSMAVLAAQHGMHWLSLGLFPGWSSSAGSAEDVNRLGAYLGAMAQSNLDESAEVVPPASDLQTAEGLGRRVAEAAHRWARGRPAEQPEAAAALVAGA